jgi:excisionase family DNA binding protein
MSTKKPTLSADELARPFAAELAAKYPPVMSPKQLAELLGKSPKTVYEWMARGRLDGAYRKRGKHVLIWRDKALEILFTGKEWTR